MTTKRVSEKQRRARRRLYILIAVAAIVLIGAFGILIDSALYYNKVHSGVGIAGDPGMELGGMTRDEATAALKLYVNDAQDNPIVLTHGNNKWAIMPSDVGTEINVEAAVATAMDITRKSNFVADLFKRFKLYFSDEEILLEGSVDNALLNQVIADIAEDIDIPPVDAGLLIEGDTLKVVESKTGNVVDRDALRTQLKELLFSLHATELSIPTIVKEPDVQAEDNAAAQEQAHTMVSTSVKLTNADNTWTLEPERLATFIDFRAEEKNGVSTLVPYISAEKMDAFFNKIADKVATKPVNATFDSDGTKAWVVPGADGEALDREKTAEAITEASLRTTQRTAEVVVKTTEPEVTTAEAEAMGIQDKLAGYTTEYGGSGDRQHNVRITTEYATDVKIAPGDIYDFERIVGPRTEARGYRKAPGIVGPGKLEDVYGGGICQVSTTIFNAAFFAGLEIVERWNHSIYIDHYPKGRDATVTVEGKNLRFRNDTGHWMWVRGTSDGVTTTINIYGTDDGREVSYTTSDFYNIVERTETSVTNTSLGVGTTVIQINGQSGKQCSVTRTITWPDGRTEKQKFVSTFPMYQKVIEVGTATTTTTVPPTTTTTTGGGSGSTSSTQKPPPTTSPVVTEF